MIRISLKGLAKFMTSTPARQRKILKDYKYPDPEGFVQAIYYREARDFIVAFHRDGHDPTWLTSKAATISTLAASSTGQTKTRLKNNSRALREYATNFGRKKFEILHDINLEVSYFGVRVTVVPDLHVREGQTEKIIKLEFSKDLPEEKAVKIIGQALYEAQEVAGMGLTSSSVLVFDVARGQIHKGARAGARMRAEIEAACQNISSLWGGI